MNKFTGLFNLHDGEDDREKTLESVRNNIDFKGANLWILACAIIIASIGLNLNAGAVVIGAMLISPLMGPIVGAGFALGIYDFSLLRKSLKNLLNSTIVSLSVSTLYFYLSPFKEVQSELLTRTSPTIYDILIAFFGGIVGVIAVTRTEKGNPIPGVAIATALMPPLCTAGYGLGTGQWSYFFGAFYLYCINCVFIGISTFLIIKYLKYPAKKQLDEKHQKQVKFIVTFITLAMLVPSAYLAYRLYGEQRFKRIAEQFIATEFTDNNYTIVYKKTNYSTDSKRIELAFLTKRFNDNELKELNDRVQHTEYLKGTKLLIRQDSTDRFSDLKGDILKQIKSTENEVNQKDVRIIQLEKELASYHFNNKQLLEESQVLFPEITSISISRHELATTKDTLIPVTAAIYESRGVLSAEEREKLKNWLNKRLSVTNISVFRKEAEAVPDETIKAKKS